MVTSGLVALVILLVFLQENKKAEYPEPSSGIEIIKVWEFPEELQEVSGIAPYREHIIAAVQDELGVIYLYDLERGKIIKEIPFAGTGDYEALTLVEETAYVANSRGDIFEVKNFVDRPVLNTFQTPLSERNDVEGLGYDPLKNRLLFGLKGPSLESGRQKQVYAYDLQKGQFSHVFGIVQQQQPLTRFFPSEIAVNPDSGEVLLLEAENPQLLKLDRSGSVKEHYYLDRKKFPQPEAMAFTQDGHLLIASEGQPGKLYKVKIE